MRTALDTVLQWVRTHRWRMVVGLLFVVLPVLIFAVGGDEQPDAKRTAQDIETIVIVGFYACVIVAIIGALVADQKRAITEGESGVVQAVDILLALFALAFMCVVGANAVTSHGPSVQQAGGVVGDSVLIGHVYWHLLDLIPAVSVQETIGWEEPIEDPSWWFGWLVLIIKALAAFAVLRVIGRVVRSWLD